MRRFHHDPPADLTKQSPLERLGRPHRGSALRRIAGGGGNHDRQIDLAELDLTIRAQRLQADLESTGDFGTRGPADDVGQVNSPARVCQLGGQTDRNRLGQNKDALKADDTLNGRIDQFRKDWKDKYNQDFDIKDEDKVYNLAKRAKLL